MSEKVKSQGQWLVDAEDARLQFLPPARQQADAHHLEGARPVQFVLRCLVPPRPGRTRRRDHGARYRRDRHPARAQEFRRLDRPHRRRRTAQDQAAAAAGHRAQRRRHDVGLGRRQDLSPRRDRDRQAQSDRQCLGQALQRDRGFDRQPADPRSQDQHGHLSQDDAARSEDAVRLVHPVGQLPAAAVALLGRGDDLEQPDLGAQSDARSGRPACG